MKWIEKIGLDRLYYAKSSLLTSVESDIVSTLALAKSNASDGYDRALDAFTTGSLRLEGALKGYADEVRIKPGVLPASTLEWQPIVAITPPVGDDNSFLYLTVDCVIPLGTGTVGYIGLIATNDYLGSPTLLSSMPCYTSINSSQDATAFSTVTSYTSSGGYLEPATIRLTIPLFGKRIGIKGFAAYAWDTGTAGFAFTGASLMYRNATAY